MKNIYKMLLLFGTVTISSSSQAALNGNKQVRTRTAIDKILHAKARLKAHNTLNPAPAAWHRNTIKDEIKKAEQEFEEAYDQEEIENAPCSRAANGCVRGMVCGAMVGYSAALSMGALVAPAQLGFETTDYLKRACAVSSGAAITGWGARELFRTMQFDKKTIFHPSAWNWTKVSATVTAIAITAAATGQL